MTYRPLLLSYFGEGRPLSHPKYLHHQLPLAGNMVCFTLMVDANQLQPTVGEQEQW
jgi:hypothetical protein